MNQVEFDTLLNQSPHLHKLLEQMNQSYGRAIALLTGTLVQVCIDPETTKLHLAVSLDCAEDETGDPIIRDLLTPSLEMLDRKIHARYSRSPD